MNHSVALLCASQQQARSSHVYPLFDMPGDFSIPFRAQGSEERDGSRGGASSSWVLNRRIKRCERTGMQLLVGGTTTIRIDCGSTDRRQYPLMGRKVGFCKPQRLARRELHRQER